MYRKEYDIRTYPKWIWSVSAYCYFEGLNWAQRKAVRKARFNAPYAWLYRARDHHATQRGRARWKEERRFVKKLYLKERNWKRNESKSTARQAVRQMIGDDEYDEKFDRILYESNSNKRWVGWLD